MQKPKVLAIIGLAMILTAIAANHTFGRLQYAQPHLLPIETFPRRIGRWKQEGEDRPIDQEVIKVLPTAHIVDRVYRDASGQIINLLMLTASDYKDFHDPNICLPGNGWQLSDRTTFLFQGQNINKMRASQRNTHLLVFYWLPGNYTANIDHGLPMQKVLSLRKALTGEEGQSLFVRVIAAENAASPDTVQRFIADIQPAIQALTEATPSR